MDIHAILSQLGQQMGLPQLKLDENRVCRLIFDQKLVVDIESTDDEKIVHLYALVGPVSPEHKEDFMAVLLEANLFGKGTGGSTFALDHNHNDVYLCRIIAIESIVYQDFVNILETFVNHLESWMNKIERGDMTPASKSTVDLPHHDSHGFDPGFLRA
jgi:hypothetical protein